MIEPKENLTHHLYQKQAKELFFVNFRILNYGRIKKQDLNSKNNVKLVFRTNKEIFLDKYASEKKY